MATVTRRELISALHTVGLDLGDMVMVHSSLSSFGHVEGGAETVVAALLEVLGQAGTLVVPTFSRYLQGETAWDREHTPSLMGRISETVRKWPGALRSSHAAHPLSALGAQAELICRRPYRTGFGADSPFKTLVEMNASILLMGVSYGNCTLFHLLEAEADVPYRTLEERKAVVTIDGARDENGGAWEYTNNGGHNDFVTFGAALEARGLVRMTTVGNSELRLFRADEAYAVGKEFMKQDPLYLLTRESRDQWREPAREELP